MDFSIEQNELGLLCREIVAGREGGGCFDEGLWRELGKAGVLAAALPESAGGDGLGLLEQCSVLTEIGRALAPAPYLASIVLGASAITAFGTPEQQQRWAVPAGRAELVLTVALEPEDPRESSASAERAGPGTGDAGAGNAGAGEAQAGGAARMWRVSGVWTGVPAAPWADLILVPAGDGVFVVERGAAGVTVEPQELTDGVTAGRVVLDGAPAERLGGPEASGTETSGQAAGVAAWLIERGTVGLCALQLGVTERALEMTAAYATSREQFGRPIGSFQAVAQRLADAWIDVAAIRLTMWQAAWRLSEALPTESGPADLAVSTAKFWAADAGHRVAHTAVHVHGGVGIDVSHPLHRYFAAATHYEFSLGGATAQLRHIGAELARL
ncbi:MAG TPA: acyl-CoA dehydrogenase family protein [Streptosporangiaceae bacterium]|nr:acyl-CoA dehydrogenase family protein [Streptosporangiaceae bacterium]